MYKSEVGSRTAYKACAIGTPIRFIILPTDLATLGPYFAINGVIAAITSEGKPDSLIDVGKDVSKSTLFDFFGLGIAAPASPGRTYAAATGDTMVSDILFKKSEASTRRPFTLNKGFKNL